MRGGQSLRTFVPARSLVKGAISLSLICMIQQNIYCFLMDADVHVLVFMVVVTCMTARCDSALNAGNTVIADCRLAVHLTQNDHILSVTTQVLSVK